MVYSLSNTSAIAVGVSGVELVVATVTSSCDITLQCMEQVCACKYQSVQFCILLTMKFCSFHQCMHLSGCYGDTTIPYIYGWITLPLYFIQAIVLRGHYEPVTLLSFSIATSPTHLCSVSADAVYIWDVGECIRDHGQGEGIVGNKMTLGRRKLRGVQILEESINMHANK